MFRGSYSQRAALDAPPAVAGYTANAVLFDGTNDWMSRAGLVGASDGVQALCSFWLKMHGGDGATQIILEDNLFATQVYRNSGNKLAFVLHDNLTVATFINFLSTASFVAASGWQHILISANVNSGPESSCYINDVLDASTVLRTGGVVGDYTVSNYYFGSRNGSLLCNMEIADFWLDFNRSYDLSNSTNRRKFITAGGAPVDLGATGQLPTGTAPLIFLKATAGTPAAFGTNVGTGGAFTITGALTAAGSNPP